MLIEIHGAGFGNKGAQLMLETVAKRLTQRFADVQLGIAAGQDRPPQDVGELGLRYLWPTKMLEGRRNKFGPLFKLSNLVARLTPSKWLTPYGLVCRKNADALIDISGYALGDKWGTAIAKNFTTLAKYYRSRNCPVILMPQMLGPFDNADNKPCFRDLFSQCNHIFARDQTSHAAVLSIAANERAISLAPDITIFNDDYQNANVDSHVDGEFVSFVPNMRVLDMGTDWTEETYLEVFVAAGQKIMTAGLDIRIVVHETFGKDAMLAEKIRAKLGLTESSIFASNDPKELKALVAKSRFLIGSRFHSLVGALSTGTPTIAIGWAHKYSQLLNDFGVGRFDIKSVAASSQVNPLIDELLNDATRESLTAGLRTAKTEMANTNDEMWRIVFELLPKTTRSLDER